MLLKNSPTLVKKPPGRGRATGSSDSDSGSSQEALSGPRAVPLGKAARAIIDALPGKRRSGAFLFPKLAEKGRCCTNTGSSGNRVLHL